MNPALESVFHAFQNPQLAGLFFDALLRGSIVLLLAAGVCALWPRASAATRHRIWLLALLSLPCLLLLSLLLSSWQKPLWSITSRFDSGNQVAVAFLFVPRTVPDRSASAVPVSPAFSTDSLSAAPAGARQFTVHFNPDWLTVIVAVWAAGFVIVSARVAAGQIQLRTIARRSRRLEDVAWMALRDEAGATLGLNRPVTLLQSAESVMPVTWGGWRPVVLLPAEATDWSPGRRRVVLLHELAHVKRGDCLTQLAAGLIGALFWCHPLVWIAIRQLRVEQERACDDLVLNGGCAASDYAGHLVEIARTFRRVPQMAGIAMARPSGLEQRVTAILDGRRNRSRAPRAAALAVAVVFLGLELLAGGYASELPTAPWSLKKSAAAAELKSFVAEKKAQAEAAAKASGQPLLPQFQSLYAAAEKGDWQVISNIFHDLRQHAPQYEHTGTNDLRLHGIQWQTVLEVWGAFDNFAVGEDKYAVAFSRDVIQSIPPGSVYFGGTDPGRFLITAMCKSQVNADPFFVLTQNALADNTYLDYARSMYGDKIYIPSSEDSQKCFQDYIQDAKQRLQNNRLKPGENVHVGENGRVDVSGEVAVMQINGLLVKLIFDRTPDREFYVEESFPLDWMYPYLEPHGLIMKINRQPLPRLSDETLAADHDYWTRQAAPKIGDWLHDGTSLADVARFVEKVNRHDLGGFTGDPRFVQNFYTYMTYAKLRSSIAGVYAWRWNQATDSAGKDRVGREADFAFRQAWAFCPYSPEVIFRYANLLIQQGRISDALLVVETSSHLSALPDDARGTIRTLLDQLKKVSAGSKAVGFEPPGDAAFKPHAAVTQTISPGTLQIRPVADTPAEDTEAMAAVGFWSHPARPETLNVQKTALLDQTAVESAGVIQDQFGAPQIQINLTDAGRKQFADVTREHLHERLAIVIDGRLYSAPVIQSEITGGRVEITGSFSKTEAQDLAVKINGAIGHPSDPAVLQFRRVLDAPADDTEPLTRVSLNPPPETFNVRKTVLLDQTGVQSATVTRDRLGSPQIEVTLNDAGRKQFAEVTHEYLHQHLAMVLNGRLYSAPVVQSEISGGKMQITGNFSDQEAQDLVARLNAAAVH